MPAGGVRPRRHAAALGSLVLAALTAGACSGADPAARRCRIVPPPAAGAAPVFPASRWGCVERPEALGWSRSGLAAVRRFSEEAGAAAVVVVHRGVVVAEWGEVDQPVNVRSARKSLLNALYGIHAGAGRVRLDATLAELAIDDHPPLTAAERRARLTDLLTSRSGIYHPAAYEHPKNRRRRPPRGSHPPGTFFYYNNWDFNALGTILARAAGADLFADFERRVARPLGMEDWDRSLMSYRREEVSEHPAYLFRISARDLARFGLLYLRDGVWRGRRILPPGWVEASTRAHLAVPGEDAHYGYLWWVVPADGAGAVPERYFYADGAGSQYLWVLPERDLVVAHLTDTDYLPVKTVLGLAMDDEKAWELLAMVVEAGPPSDDRRLRPRSPAAGAPGSAR
ncbi:MAG TPA: serine hydrolase [Thermoanaerobaculia bacterium]|nr:serine hydrolase [Thermoanaerobaculia bacterium]